MIGFFLTQPSNLEINNFKGTDLKVGSFSFECIMILLIYFINCPKALFTRQ